MKTLLCLRHARTILTLAFALAMTPCVHAATYIFTRIVASPTEFSIPSDAPMINNLGQVAFYGMPASNLFDQCLARGDGGALTTIVSSLNTPIVPALVAFTSGSYAMNDAGQVGFGAYNANGSGVYRSDGTTTIALDDTADPNVFPSINASGTLAFQLSTPTGVSIFYGDSSTLTPVASAGPSAPFGTLSNPSINDAGTIAFTARDHPPEGGGFPLEHIYTSTPGGVLTEVTNTSTGGWMTIGGGLAGNLVLSDSGALVFQGMKQEDGRQGIYLAAPSGGGYTISTITETNGPYAGFRFDALSGLSINATNAVAFIATLDESGISGIFTGPDPVADKVVSIGDTLDGKTVQSVNLGRFALNDSGEVAFFVTFTDNTGGVYRATPSGEPPVDDPDIADTFTLNGTTRTAGAFLHGQTTEIGGVTWSGRNAWEFTADGRIAIGNPPQPGGVETRIISVPYVPLPGETVTIQGDVVPPYLNNESPGVFGSIGFCINPSPYFDLGFYNETSPGSGQGIGQLWMLLAKDGSWNIFASHNIPVANGPPASAPNFQPTGLNQLRLKYNSASNTVSAAINGVPVVTNQSLGAFTPNIQRTGFFFHRTDGAAFDNFAVNPPPDLVTQAPTLNAPAAGTLTSNPVSVSYTLPEAALAGSVQLNFHDGVIARILNLTGESAGTHIFNFNPAIPTASPQVASGPAIPDGTYSAVISYQDREGNSREYDDSMNVTIDTTAPDTTITSGPSGEVENGDVTFTFASNPPGATFTCQMDTQPAELMASSPKNYTGLSTGPHTFTVFATDAAGNTEPTPATRTFTVVNPLTYATLFEKGGPVPGAGVNPYIPTDAAWFSFGIPAINDAGNVAYIGKWRNPVGSPAGGYGIGIFGGAPAALLTYVGATATGGAGAEMTGVTFKSFRDPVLTANGGVAFLAMLTGTGVSATNDLALYHLSGGVLRLVVREGQEMTGAPGSELNSVASLAAWSSAGGSTVLFTGSLRVGPAGTPGPGLVTRADDSAAWRWDSTSGLLSLVVREGSSISGVSASAVKTFKLLKTAAGSPGTGRGLWQGATVSFQAKFADKTEALVDADLSGATKVYGSGETTVPGASGATWRSFGAPATPGAADGRAFFAKLNTVAGGVTSTTASRLFFEGAAIDSVATGDDAPDLAVGTKFSSFKDPVISPNATAFAFAGMAILGTAATSALWWQSDNEALTLSAALGAEPPGSFEAEWKAFTSIAATDLGPIFTAKLLVGAGGTPGPGGITTATDLGLWATDGDGILRKLLQEGGSLSGKTVKTFTVLTAASGSQGVRRSYTADGQIIIRVAFTDNTTALVKVTLP